MAMGGGRGRRIAFRSAMALEKKAAAGTIDDLGKRRLETGKKLVKGAAGAENRAAAMGRHRRMTARGCSSRPRRRLRSMAAFA